MFNVRNKSDKTKRAIASILAFAIATQFSSTAVKAVAKEIGSLSNEKLKVAVLSDPHYFPKEFVTNTDNEQYKDYMAKELYLLAESAEIFEAALKMVAEDKPDFLLIPGDMTKNGEALGTERVAQILDTFEKETGISVFIINGNHDLYDNAFAFNGENGNVVENIPVVSVAQYLSLYGDFGYSDENEVNDIVYFGDNEGEVLDTMHPELSYVTTLKEGYVLLSLNSQLYSTNEDGKVKHAGGGFNEDLLAWAEKQIKEAEANGDTVIAMSHHGIIPHSLASELSEGSAVVNNWEDTATRLADAGLRYIFTGHMHENDIAEFTTASGNTLYDIETGATAAYGAPVRTVEFEKSSNDKSEGADIKETVTVSSKSVKSTENIEDLQSYMYDFIYKDSKYLEVKLGKALEPIVSQLENLSLYELIYGQATLSEEFSKVEELQPVVKLMENNTLTEEEKEVVKAFDMAEELTKSFGEALEGKTIEIEGQGSCILKYDEESKEISLYSAANASVNLNADINSNAGENISTDTSADEDTNLGADASENAGLATNSNARLGVEDILGSLNVETALKDIIKQIDDKVLEPGVLQGEVKKIIKSILGMEVYVTDTAEKKVLNDVVNLFLVDHFLGAEDLSGWPQELLDKLAQGENVREIIDRLIDNVLDILPEILKKITVNAKALTDDKILQAGINALLLFSDKSYYTLLTRLNVDIKGIVRKPINEYLDSYITESFERQIGVLVGDLIYGLAGDDTQDDKIDGGARVITYTGVVPQEPTVANGLLPHSIAITFGADENTEKAFSWYTGKNVPNNEIQIVKASDAKMKANGEVDFTNATVIKADSEIVKRAFPTVDLGLIAITKDKEVSRHQVLLSGLQPGSKYYYKVGSAENGIYSDIATFETAEVNDNSFTFLNFSDTQSMLESEYEGWADVVDTAFDMYPDAKFVTHAGDMVDNGKNELQWQWFLNKPQDLMNTTFVGASGNHEEFADFSHINHFNIQDLPEQDLTTGAYYKVDYGNALVMVINTNNLGEDKGLSQEQIDWIKETANNSDAKWKIIQTHKAPYSNGSHYTDEDVVAIRAQLDSIVTELKIDFVLEGHDHTYARSEYLVNGEIEESLIKEEKVVDGVTYETALNPEGTIYAITGTSGVKFYNPNETGLPLAFSPDIQVPVFAAVTVEGDMLYYNAYTVDTESKSATLIDTFAIEKTAKEADTVAPVISGVNDGDKYYIDRTVIASDNEELESVTINGVEVNGKYEIVASNEEKEYIVVATDKSGNTSEVKFTMAPLPTVDNIGYGEGSLSLINEIKSEFEAMKNTLYGDRIAYYTNLIEALEEAYEICEAVIADFALKVEELPAAEDVTAEDVKEIKGVLAIYRSFNEEERDALGKEVIAKLKVLEESIKVYSLVTADNKVSVEFVSGADGNNGYFDLGTVLIAANVLDDAMDSAGTSAGDNDETVDGTKAVDEAGAGAEIVDETGAGAAANVLDDAGAKAGVFEIKAILDNVEVLVNGKLKVTIDLEDLKYGENNKLYLISKDGLTKNEISTSVADGKLIFETDELGKFMVVDMATTEERNELSTIIEKAEAIDTDKYTVATVKTLKEALAEAKEVLSNDEATSSNVLNAIERLNSAIHALEEKVIVAPEVNKEELAELIEKLLTVDTKLYTAESVKIFTNRLDEAKAILSKENATQEEVDKAVKALRDATEGLVEKDESAGDNEGGTGNDNGNGTGNGTGNGSGSDTGSESGSDNGNEDENESGNENESEDESGNGSGNGNGDESGSGNGQNNSSTESNKLPQTGGVNSIFTIALGALTAIGGALSLKKKKQ